MPSAIVFPLWFPCCSWVAPHLRLTRHFSPGIRRQSHLHAFTAHLTMNLTLSGSRFSCRRPISRRRRNRCMREAIRQSRLLFSWEGTQVGVPRTLRIGSITRRRRPNLSLFWLEIEPSRPRTARRAISNLAKRSGWTIQRPVRVTLRLLETSPANSCSRGSR